MNKIFFASLLLTVVPYFEGSCSAAEDLDNSRRGNAAPKRNHTPTAVFEGACSVAEDLDNSRRGNAAPKRNHTPTAHNGAPRDLYLGMVGGSTLITTLPRMIQAITQGESDSKKVGNNPYNGIPDGVATIEKACVDSNIGNAAFKADEIDTFIESNGVQEIINLALHYEEDDLSTAKRLYQGALQKAMKDGDSYPIDSVKIRLGAVILYSYKDKEQPNIDRDEIAQAAGDVIEAAIEGERHPILQKLYDQHKEFAGYVGKKSRKDINKEKAVKVLLKDLFPNQDWEDGD